MAVVFMITVAVAVIAIVAVLGYHRGKFSTEAQKGYNVLHTNQW